MPNQERELRASRTCIFCGFLITHVGQDWQCIFRSVLDEPKSITRSVKLDNLDPTNLPPSDVLVRYDESFQHRHGYLFHSPCFRELHQQILPDRLRIADILRLARVKQPFFSNPAGDRTSLRNWLLESQLEQILNLPLELRYFIYELLPADIYVLWIANVRMVTLPLFLAIQKCVLPPAGNCDSNCSSLIDKCFHRRNLVLGDVQAFVVYMRPPFRGIKYVCGFRTLPNGSLSGYDDPTHRSSIKIPSEKVIWMIQIAMDELGVRKIRLFAENDWCSEWAGDLSEDAPRLRYLFIRLRQSQSQNLTTWFDDYKCRFFQGPYPHFDAQFLWNQPPSITQAVTAEGFFETVGNFGPTEEQSFPGLRLINYVPLFIENDNLHGVTMYCRRGGIVGIEVSFEKVQQITGRAEGCSIHFPIRALDGEYISDVWVRVRNTSTQLRIGVEPAVVIRTTFNRYCTFGPYLEPENQGDYDWKRLTKERLGTTAGFYYNALKLYGSCLMSFGLTFQASTKPNIESPIPQHLGLPKRPIFGAPNSGLFSSVASLENVTALRIRTAEDNKRCTGMMVYHEDGLVEVLGQWSNNHSTGSTIYSRDDGLLMALRLQMTGDEPKAYVSKVFVRTDQHNDSAAFDRYKELDLTKTKNIVWWFSEYYDHVDIRN